MKKIYTGVVLGFIAGVLDVIPMILQKLTWDANLSAFTLWVVSGFLLSVTELKIHPVLRGIVIPFLVLAPSAALISRHQPFILIPITITTLFLGALMGFAYWKLAKNG
jgi:hypothetical protein